MPIRNHRAWSNKKRVLTTTATVILASVVGPGHAETVVQEFDTVIVIGTTPSPPRIEIPYFTSTYDYRARSGSTFEPTASVGIALEHGDCGGNPVERLGGNKVEFETDFKGGGEMPLVMHRTYHQGATTFNHARALRGILGTQWRTSFDYAVEMQAGNYAIWAWRPDGRRIMLRSVHGNDRFEEVRPGGKLNPKMWAEAISEGGSTITKIILHTEDNETETYPIAYHDMWYGNGFISERRNAQGLSWKFTYSAMAPTGRLTKVEHSSGRSVLFQWQVGSVTAIDPDGNTYRYETPNGRLAKATLPGLPATVVTYHYEDKAFPDALTGKSFDGVRYSTFAYDAQGRAISSEHAGGVALTRFAFSGQAGGTSQTTETNALGRRTIHSYENGRKVSVTGEASAHCGSRYRSLTYDANGFEDVVVGFDGKRTDFDYDSHGHLTRVVEAAGQPGQRTTSYVWDELVNRVVGTTLEGVWRIDHTYDNHRLTSEVITDLASGDTRTTQYGYTFHPNGMVATYTADGPQSGSSDRTTWSYDATGNLIQMRNGIGQATTYERHTGLGQPGRVTLPSGAITEYEYDGRGRLAVERTYPNGSPVETRYVHGGSGLLEARYASDGTTALYHYDAARRLIQEDVSDPDGTYAVRRITYNAMSQPIRTELGRDR